jgi:hypothetical protein
MMNSECSTWVAHDDTCQGFTSVLMIHQVLKARTSTGAQIESVNIPPVTRAYELTFRDDRPKSVNVMKG